MVGKVPDNLTKFQDKQQKLLSNMDRMAAGRRRAPDPKLVKKTQAPFPAKPTTKKQKAAAEGLFGALNAEDHPMELDGEDEAGSAERCAADDPYGTAEVLGERNPNAAEEGGRGAPSERQVILMKKVSARRGPLARLVERTFTFSVGHPNK
jgi:hypothetical protein